MTAFDRAQARLQRFADDTAASPALYPISANLTPIAGGPVVPIRLRFKKPSSAHATENRSSSNILAVESNNQQTATLPPGVIVALGDEFTVLSPADLAGRSFYVTDPLYSRDLGMLATIKSAMLDDVLETLGSSVQQVPGRGAVETLGAVTLTAPCALNIQAPKRSEPLENGVLEHEQTAVITVRNKPALFVAGAIYRVNGVTWHRTSAPAIQDGLSRIVEITVSTRRVSRTG